MEDKNLNEEEIRDDLLDVLLDHDNTDPIVLMGGDGRKISFEQVAVIPYDSNLYCILKPLDKIEGVGEEDAIVFLVDTDETGASVVRVEEDMEIAEIVFDKYYDLLRDARKNNDQ